MTTYQPAPIPYDSLAAKVQYSWPEGDANVIESRQTVVWKSDQPSYAPGSIAKVWIYSNGQNIDLANSFFGANISLQITGNGVPQINQYAAVKPILKGGIEDLIREFRVRSYGGVDMEYLRYYNYISMLRQWCAIPRSNNLALARASLRGDCLNAMERYQIVDNSASASNLGLQIYFRPESSGFFDTRRFLPLRYMNQIQFEFTWETPTQGFQMLGGLAPTGAGGATSIPSLSYLITNLNFYADMVTLSPEMEVALQKAVDEKEGIPIYFDTFEVQVDQVGYSQSYTQRINKSVANAVRVMSILQPQGIQNNPMFDSFASEPMGLNTYQYRLGTVYYPKDQVDVSKGNLLRAVIEADKAMNYSCSKREYPPSDIREQIGDRLYANSLSSVGLIPAVNNVTIVATPQNAAQLMYSCNNYYPPYVPFGTTGIAGAGFWGSNVMGAAPDWIVNSTNAPGWTNGGTTVAGGSAPNYTILKNGSWKYFAHSFKVTASPLIGVQGASNASDVGVLSGPVNSLRAQITADSSGLISNHGYGSSIDKELNYQLYMPHVKSVPTKFRIGSSLQMSPDAWVTGVSTAHGHQLELFIRRFAPPTNVYPFLLSYISSLYPVDGTCFTINTALAASQTALVPSNTPSGVASAQVAKVASSGPITGADPMHGALVGINNATIRPGTGTAAMSVNKNVSFFSWGANDACTLFSFLQYTRLILIKKEYNIQIRE